MAEIVDERREVQPSRSTVNRGRVWSPDGGCQTSKRTIILNWGSDAKKSRAASNLSSNTRLSMRQVIYLPRWKAGLITRTAATVNTMHPWQLIQLESVRSMADTKGCRRKVPSATASRGQDVGDEIINTEPSHRGHQRSVPH